MYVRAFLRVLWMCVCLFAYLCVQQEDAADELGIAALRKQGTSDQEIIAGSLRFPASRLWAAGFKASLLRKRGEVG